MMLTNLSSALAIQMLDERFQDLQKGKWSKFCSLICLCSNFNLISNAVTSENMSDSDLPFP
jgi:hypothetical protein